MKTRKLLLSFSLIILFLFLTGCSSKSSQSTTNTNSSTENVYKIATGTEFAPLLFESSQGQYEGISIDVLEEIAKEESFEYDIETLDYDEAVEKLKSEEIDAILTGIVKSNKDVSEFDFSDAYLDSGISGAVKKDSKILTYEDLDKKKVGALGGSESLDYIEKIKDRYHFEVVAYSNDTELYKALNDGEIEAIFSEYPKIGYAIKNGEDFELLGDVEDQQGYGLMITMNNSYADTLLESFNEGLKYIKSDGSYQKILDKYIKK